MNFKVIISWILVCLIFLLLTGIVKNSQQMKVAAERLTDARNKVLKLTDQHNYLVNDNLERNSEAYIEEQIRNKFNLVKPGETLVLLPLELKDQTEEKHFFYEAADTSLEPAVPVWKDWLELFF